METAFKKKSRERWDRYSVNDIDVDNESFIFAI